MGRGNTGVTASSGFPATDCIEIPQYPLVLYTGCPCPRVTFDYLPPPNYPSNLEAPQILLSTVIIAGRQYLAVQVIHDGTDQSSADDPSEQQLVLSTIVECIVATDTSHNKEYPGPILGYKEYTQWPSVVRHMKFSLHAHFVRCMLNTSSLRSLSMSNVSFVFEQLECSTVTGTRTPRGYFNYLRV